MNGISKRKDSVLLRPVLRICADFPPYKRSIMQAILRRIKTKELPQNPGHECWDSFENYLSCLRTHSGKVKKCLVDATLYKRCLDNSVNEPPKEPLQTIKILEAIKLAREGKHFRYVNPFLSELGAGSAFKFADRGLFGSRK